MKKENSNKKLRHFRCTKCGRVTATTGHIPICKKCGKKPMEEIK